MEDRDASDELYDNIVKAITEQGIDPSVPINGYTLAGAISGQVSGLMGGIPEIIELVVRQDVEDRGPIYQAIKEAINSEK